MTEIPEPEWEAPEPTTRTNRMPLLIALGALATFAAILAIYKSSVDAQKRAAVDTHDLGDDWKTAYLHLADALSLRLDGIGERLDTLERAAHPVVPRDVELADDLPAPVDAAPDIEPLPAPAPAHVSVPDIEGLDQ